MAETGEKRPIQRSAIGKALCHYTQPSSTGYDADFNTAIRQLAPQWFESAVSIKKEQLLRLAHDGDSRPSQVSLLGKALSRYTSKGMSHDDDFTVKIHAIAPQWFGDNWHKSI
jgi:hypothetical protein